MDLYRAINVLSNSSCYHNSVAFLFWSLSLFLDACEKHLRLCLLHMHIKNYHVLEKWKKLCCSIRLLFSKINLVGYEGIHRCIWKVHKRKFSIWCHSIKHMLKKIGWPNLTKFVGVEGLVSRRFNFQPYSFSNKLLAIHCLILNI